MALKHVARRKTKPGIDGFRVEKLKEKATAQNFLAEIEDELKLGVYTPSPLKRSYIKERGKERCLGIPTLKDRTVQTACRIILSAIFEADFHACSYGYREKKSAHNAIARAKRTLERGYTNVYVVDIEKFFDNISHDIIMDKLEKRIADPKILTLIQRWLAVPWEDEDITRTKGTPQGGAISPLLANIVLNEVDQKWYDTEGPSKQYSASMIRYADDIIIMTKEYKPEVIEAISRGMERLELNLNPNKSKSITLCPTKQLHYLGYTFALMSPSGEVRAKVILSPQEEKVITFERELRSLKSEITRTKNIKRRDRLEKKIMDKVRGYSNYYCLSTHNPLLSLISSTVNR